MSNIINIYCDESCHLERDRIPIMVLGCVWTPADAVQEVSRAVRQIKTRHGLSPTWEAKWTKVSSTKTNLYLDFVNLFFDETSLHFRGIVIPDKTILDHAAFDQSHDSWYYKMMFQMLNPVIDPEREHCVYLDIKDTRSENKRKELERVLRNTKYDGTGAIVRRVQQIRSHESEILQLADLLLGAVGYHSRVRGGDLQERPQNAAKLEVIRKIQERSGKSLERTTWLQEKKFNLLFWEPKKENRERVQ